MRRFLLIGGALALLTATALKADDPATRNGVVDLSNTVVPSIKTAASAAVAVPARIESHRFAVVGGDGVLSRGHGVLSITRFAPGYYEVLFDVDVSDGAYVAALGAVSTGPAPIGIVGTASRAGKLNGVWVEVTNLAGTHTDLPFHLTVSLP